MTFVHHFNHTLSVTMTVADAPPVNGETFIQAVEWTERPKLEHLPEYLQWSHTVYSQMADHWDMRLMNAVQTSPNRWEFWAYAPGEPPKLLCDEV
jgi:hypothetical protein